MTLLPCHDTHCTIIKLLYMKYRNNTAEMSYLLFDTNTCVWKPYFFIISALHSAFSASVISGCFLFWCTAIWYTMAPQATLSMKSTTFPNSPFTHPSITSKFLMSITLAPTLNSRTSGSPRANCVSVLVCLYHFRPPFCLLGLGHLWMLPSLMHCHMVHHGTTGNIYALPYGTPWHHRQHLICTAIWYTMVPQATSMHCHMVHHGTTGNILYALPYGTPWYHRQHLCTAIWYTMMAPQATLSMKSTTFRNSPFTNPSITSKFLMSITLAPTLNSRTSGSPPVNHVSVLVWCPSRVLGVCFVNGKTFSLFALRLVLLFLIVFTWAFVRNTWRASVR